jgi:hypothetical protein
MKCDLPIELLSGYLDGELDDEQKARVEDHLKECSACQEELEALRQIDDHVKDEVFEEPSREFVFTLNRRVMDKIRPSARRSLFRFAPVFVPVAAAFLILIVLINISPSTKIAQLDDRMVYQELVQRQEVPVSIPEPKIATVPASMKRAARVGKHKAAAAQTEETRIAEADETYDIAELEVMTLPGEGVVRAIIDSTGMVIKVATGNTRIPEKDTMLENRLSGQQLAPPLIAGRKKQVYVDFAATDEKDD